MEALTTAFKLWTSIEKVQSDRWTGSLDFTLNSFRQTCKTTNSATESPRSKCSVCQGSRAPASCEEAQEAQQRQQEMCCCQTLQREGAHCLCAWHWPQPSGFNMEWISKISDQLPFSGAQCCTDQKWKTAGCAQCVDKVCPRKIWPAPRGQEELVCSHFKSNIYRVMIVRALFCKYTICSRFSTTACHNLVKKPHGKVKLVNNLFKPDAVKKVWQ